jgi:IS5 family transposase
MTPLPKRLMAGPAILRHKFNLSDEELCSKGGDPLYQFLWGQTFFRHDLPFDLT